VTGAEILPQDGSRSHSATQERRSLYRSFPGDRRQLESLTTGEQRYLLGPIVYHPGGWDAGDILPKFIPQARLELVLSGEKNLPRSKKP